MLADKHSLNVFTALTLCARATRPSRNPQTLPKSRAGGARRRWSVSGRRIRCRGDMPHVVGTREDGTFTSSHWLDGPQPCSRARLRHSDRRHTQTRLLELVPGAVPPRVWPLSTQVVCATTVSSSGVRRSTWESLRILSLGGAAMEEGCRSVIPGPRFALANTASTPKGGRPCRLVGTTSSTHVSRGWSATHPTKSIQQ